MYGKAILVESLSLIWTYIAIAVLSELAVSLL